MASVETQPCSKCHRTGTITRFGHVLEGVCFQCKGSGVTKKRKIINEKKSAAPRPKPLMTDFENWTEEERESYNNACR